MILFDINYSYVHSLDSFKYYYLILTILFNNNYLFAHSLMVSSKE